MIVKQTSLLARLMYLLPKFIGRIHNVRIGSNCVDYVDISLFK